MNAWKGGKKERKEDERKGRVNTIREGENWWKEKDARKEPKQKKTVEKEKKQQEDEEMKG